MSYLVWTQKMSLNISRLKLKQFWELRKHFLGIARQIKSIYSCLIGHIHSFNSASECFPKLLFFAILITYCVQTIIDDVIITSHMLSWTTYCVSLKLCLLYCNHCFPCKGRVVFYCISMGKGSSNILFQQP